MSIACSVEVAWAELGLELLDPPSLGLLVLVGFVFAELAGEAVTGGGR